MAFWQKKEKEMEETFAKIKENPGLNPAELAQQMGVAPSTIQRRLPGMEEAGWMLAEDERGGLWPFGRRSK